MTRRDQQRTRLYDAEACLPDGKRYPTVAEAQARVDTILASKFVTGRWGPRYVEVHDGRGHRRAVSYRGTIALPRWARCELVILHELAHELAPYGEKHSPQFVRVFHDLLRRFMGVEVAERFLVECAARNVKIEGKRLPRSKVTDDHRQQVAAERESRRLWRESNTLTAAVDVARKMAEQHDQPTAVYLDPGVGYSWGPAGPGMDAVFEERKRAMAVVHPDGTTDYREELR